MELRSTAFVGGKILDKYGGRSGVFHGPMSAVSFPLEILDFPAETRSFALIFDDPDAVKPAGTVWIHWLVAGLKKNHLPENASRTDPSLVQGVTSWYPAREPDILAACHYGGPNPPDCPHKYVLRAFALDCDTSLETGFTYGDLTYEMRGHILAEARLEGYYLPKTQI